jgi:hypothetical protein
MIRPLVLAVAAAAAVVLSPLSAAASPPSNDSVAAAQLVGAPLPWTWTQDTTQATIEPVDERVVRDGCALSIGLNGTVWFRYTDTAGSGFAVDVRKSDFLASVAVVEGDPETGPVVACAEGRVAAATTPGETYWIMAYSDRPSVNGGRLELSVEPLRPAPTATLSMDASATAYADGTVVVSGTYSCENADGATTQLMGSVSQGTGSRERSNYFFMGGLDCDGTVHGWEAPAVSYSGQPVAAGRAHATASFFACGDLQCAVGEVDQVVQVRRAVSR